MRILSEIIDDVIDGKMPTHEECYYALKVYRAMLNIDHRQFREELLSEKRSPEFIRKMKAEGSFYMYKDALSAIHKEWLGE
ncbi:hypothetical protein [Brevibacillus laterosporus]|uniref:hypothetical protein n=1 Tax=Brevibacillus laterosporus TaxID=1465 RepID=UPI000B9BB54B|nr:hypothetical protein [Brevibacillus laterosporus]